MFAYQRTANTGAIAPDENTNEGRLALYLVDTARDMGLLKWQFSVYVGDPSGFTPAKSDACIEVAVGSNEAHIVFDVSWVDWTPEYLRNVVVHELCHTFFNNLQDMIQAQRETWGTLFYGPFYEAFRQELERSVDFMSRGWSELLPLPDVLDHHRAANNG